VRYGTGALVSSHLAITNNHVLESEGLAANAFIELGYYEGGGMLRLRDRRSGSARRLLLHTMRTWTSR
jgi:hypothetical protein